MTSPAQAAPAGFHSVTANLVVRDAAAAIDFYKKAFGAEETVRMPGPGGLIMHAELRLGDSMIMLNDEMPDAGVKSPKAYGGTPVSFYVYFADVDAAWTRAIDAGARPLASPADMFWGDRTGRVEDPFGHIWSLAQHIRDLTPAEMKKGAEDFFAQLPKKS